jgi:ferredoxin
MSAVTASSIVVRKSAFTAGRVSLRAKATGAVAMKPRGMTVMAFKVTLETPEGAQSIECADDTYILDAAEVSRAATTTHLRRAR